MLPVCPCLCLLASCKNAPSKVCALMLQGGSDVITKTALKRISWSAYKINQATDKIGVFVSIVSTKIPYKGAGKEYIGMSSTRACCNVLHHGRKDKLLVQIVMHSLTGLPLLAADDMDELVHAVKHAIQQCGLQVHICSLLQIAADDAIDKHHMCAAHPRDITS